MIGKSDGGGLRLRQRVVASGGMWGLFGQVLKFLQVGLALFFQNVGPGMGGEGNKRCLSPYLAIFQFLESKCMFGLFSLASGISRFVRGCE